MSNEKRPVTLEDLLRLKRVERPPAEFWSEFDRQLRAKQLAALVQRRPWWSSLRSSVVGLTRFHVAFGAVAVLAISFISLRDETPAARPGNNPDAALAVVAPATVAAAEAETSATAPAIPAVELKRPLSNSNSVPAEFVAMTEPLPAADGPRAVEVASQPVAEVNAFEALTAQSTTAGHDADTPSAKFIAANYAAAQETIGGALLAEVPGFEVRSTTRIAKVDPLQQMAPPGEPRRSTRFLNAMVSTAQMDVTAQTTERMANRISPEELYDQVRRFGTRQGGLNVRF